MVPCAPGERSGSKPEMIRRHLSGWVHDPKPTTEERHFRGGSPCWLHAARPGRAPSDQCPGSGRIGRSVRRLLHGLANEPGGQGDREPPPTRLRGHRRLGSLLGPDRWLGRSLLISLDERDDGGLGDPPLSAYAALHPIRARKESGGDVPGDGFAVYTEPSCDLGSSQVGALWV